MDNKKRKPRKLRRALEGKGYYIALILCIVAVGVSGYIFIRAALSERETSAETETSLNVPVVIEEIPEDEDAADNAVDSETASTDSSTAETADVETSDAVEAASVTGDLDETVAAEAEETIAAEAEESVKTLDDLEVCWPVSGLVTKNYSMEALVFNATMGDWRVHEGIDISAEEGTEVVAAGAGTVTSVYEDDLMGTVVVVDHGGGYETLYANLAETTLVNAGDTVEAGAPIGYVGATALAESAEEPHLHLEVLCNGERIDPTVFLS